MIEVDAHQHLHAFLREHQPPAWPHHLTMTRLVARALRVQHNTLIQTGSPSVYYGHHRLSYLVPLLLWTGPVVLVAPPAVQQQLLLGEIPQLQQWLANPKAVRQGSWPGGDFQGILVTSPQEWLRDRLGAQQRFPPGVPTVFDGIDDLETWTQEILTVSLYPHHWRELILAYPSLGEEIQTAWIRLTHAVFQHPVNPYDCYLIEANELDILTQLQASLGNIPGPEDWERFWQGAQDSLTWVTVNRSEGYFSLHRGPQDVASFLEGVWAQQPVCLIGGAVDAEAEVCRRRLGLGDLSYLKFSLDRHQEIVQLYLPEGLPLPNTPQFEATLIQEVCRVLGARATETGIAVILVGDVPLRQRLGVRLAAEFGSRVQVDRLPREPRGVLVCGWSFWQEHQAQVPTPHTLGIATLPIPSLEDPLVAGRLAQYKHLQQDWFRLYLLPDALRHLQRATAPMRKHQGLVVIFDMRVVCRSYGQQILAALSPLARTNYLETDWIT